MDPKNNENKASQSGGEDPIFAGKKLKNKQTKKKEGSLFHYCFEVLVDCGYRHDVEFFDEHF